MIIAFDLDGTLADLTHRLPYIQKDPKDWHAFFAACSSDKPIWQSATVLHALHQAGHWIEIWSGRSDEVREQTERWLEGNGIQYDALRMRVAGDHRPDHIVKAEWLDSLDAPNRPKLAFDDRDQVVTMWRAHDIPCFQVAPGNF